jgi:signal peptidase I
MDWRLKTTMAVTAVIGVVLVCTGRRVVDEDMAPSIAAEDWVWIVPGLPIQRGDVVRLVDPLDPERTILRRAIADGGKEVRFDEGGIRVGPKRIRQKDMGGDDTYTVLQETIWSKPPAKSTDWLIRKRSGASAAWTADAVSVPEDHWFLVADDRDNAVDSRWWGPVPAAAIDGVVRLRWGPPSEWRHRAAYLTGTDNR